jgi:S1-C subfamily serine protease
LDIVYNGEELVKEIDPEKVINYSGPNNGFENNNNTITFSASYRFKFKPSYRISKVLQNSPAALVGILPDDILLKINGNSVHDLSIAQLIKKLQTKDGKKINLTIRRGVDILKFQFKLKKRV